MDALHSPFTHGSVQEECAVRGLVGGGSWGVAWTTVFLSLLLLTLSLSLSNPPLTPTCWWLWVEQHFLHQTLIPCHFCHGASPPWMELFDTVIQNKPLFL